MTPVRIGWGSPALSHDDAVLSSCQLWLLLPALFHGTIGGWSSAALTVSVPWKPTPSDGSAPAPRVGWIAVHLWVGVGRGWGVKIVRSGAPQSKIRIVFACCKKIM